MDFCNVELGFRGPWWLPGEIGVWAVLSWDSGGLNGSWEG